jgi:Dimerisation and cyclophilin-binding domain of Mon2
MLIDRIVSTICMCFRGVQTEEQVELQIIKVSCALRRRRSRARSSPFLQALLTIMTSQTIEIHQRSVLQIIKTCFNIYLTSRSKINEATAQGCLAQMLNGIFSKMEQKMVRPALNRHTHWVCSRLSWTNGESNLKRTRLAKARPPSMPNIFPQVALVFDSLNAFTIAEIPLVVKEILDELVEKICYGEHPSVRTTPAHASIHLDEATQEKENVTLSTNEIIEDIRSTHDEFNNGLSRNILGEYWMHAEYLLTSVTFSIL